MISRWSLGSHKSTGTRITRGWWLRRRRKRGKRVITATIQWMVWMKRTEEGRPNERIEEEVERKQVLFLWLYCLFHNNNHWSHHQTEKLMSRDERWAIKSEGYFVRHAECVSGEPFKTFIIQDKREKGIDEREREGDRAIWSGFHPQQQQQPGEKSKQEWKTGGDESCGRERERDRPSYTSLWHVLSLDVIWRRKFTERKDTIKGNLSFSFVTCDSSSLWEWKSLQFSQIELNRNWCTRLFPSLSWLIQCFCKYKRCSSMSHTFVVLLQQRLMETITYQNMTYTAWRTIREAIEEIQRNN